MVVWVKNRGIGGLEKLIDRSTGGGSRTERKSDRRIVVRLKERETRVW
jgi:hypothetical protein